jgi:hypothetical protein
MLGWVLRSLEGSLGRRETVTWPHGRAASEMTRVPCKEKSALSTLLKLAKET